MGALEGGYEIHMGARLEQLYVKQPIEGSKPIIDAIVASNKRFGTEGVPIYSLSDILESGASCMTL